MDIKKKLIIYFVIGLIASLVPLKLIAHQLETDPSVQKEINYYQFVKFSPLLFGIFNVIFLYIMNEYFPEVNLWATGVIAGLLISSYGRFVQKLPTKVFKMTNPNIFHLYATIVWSIFYGFIAKNILNTCDSNCANLILFW